MLLNGGVFLAAQGNARHFHAHKLSIVYHLVHAAVQNQIVLAVVGLPVGYMGKVLSAGSGQKPAQLQRYSALPGHALQVSPELRQKCCFVQLLAEVADGKAGAVFQLRAAPAGFRL